MDETFVSILIIILFAVGDAVILILNYFKKKHSSFSIKGLSEQEKLDYFLERFSNIYIIALLGALIWLLFYYFTLMFVAMMCFILGLVSLAICLYYAKYLIFTKKLREKSK